MSSVLDTLSGVTPRPQLTPNGVQVIPYNALLDPQSQYFLPWFWQKLKEDGLVSLYYPGQEETGFPHFVKMMSGGVNIALVVAKDEEDKPQNAIGFVSWEPLPFGRKTAMAGFIFLKKFWDHKHSTDAANEVMKYWFSTDQMDVAIGMVAAKNLVAQRFLKRLGWVQSGYLPGCHHYAGEDCDATIWFMNKEQFCLQRP